MERHTLQKRIEMIKIQYKNGENLEQTVRKTQTFFGRRQSFCWTAIQKLVKIFELLRYISDVKI